jgi:hypothetical protein
LGQGADSFAQEVHRGAVGLAQQLIQLHLGHDHRVTTLLRSSLPRYPRMQVAITDDSLQADLLSTRIVSRTAVRPWLGRAGSEALSIRCAAVPRETTAPR